MQRKLSSLLILGWVLTACRSPISPTDQAPVPSLTSTLAGETVVQDQTPRPAAPTSPPPTLELLDTQPQRVEFQTEDGVKLVGTYWPPAEPPAAGVILMHWARGDRRDWLTLGTLLQGQAIAKHQTAGQLASGYAVFAFDFRGYGESGADIDWSFNIADAQAAIAFFKTLPGVNPDRFFVIGASIGADAGVNTCREGCAGVITLSPDAYLGIPYEEALARLDDKPVLCAAAEGDLPSSEACHAGEKAGLSDYQAQFYAGAEHGMEMFGITEEVPALIDLIFGWLHTHTS